ncbi:MAG: L,D-transpeptidase family protein [Pseudomonadota bacterium]|nr:L,D-transpeptidase family protein [Pseudomonadota bacterium]
MRRIKTTSLRRFQPFAPGHSAPPADRYRHFILCTLALLGAILLAGCATKPEKLTADRVVVKKSERKLMLLSDGEVVREYRVALGDSPRGHKMEEGDERTPEGEYTLDWRNPNSRFHKSIHVSYPNERDVQFARFLDQSPGGMIMIHGQPNHIRSAKVLAEYERRDWTDGCIAVKNEEMNEIWTAVGDGTPIQILP